MPMRVYVRECTGEMWTGSPAGPCLRFHHHELAMEIAQRSARRFAATWHKEAVVFGLDGGKAPKEIVRFAADGTESRPWARP